MFRWKNEYKLIKQCKKSYKINALNWSNFFLNNNKFKLKEIVQSEGIIQCIIHVVVFKKTFFWLIIKSLKIKLISFSIQDTSIGLKFICRFYWYL